MKKVFLGLGGNIGDVAKTLKEAESRLCKSAGIYDVKFSKLYRTSPVSDIPQDDFINCVCELLTTLSVRKLFEVTQEIEKSLGKEKKAKNAPRSIDIDVLVYGDETIIDNDIEIPHPKWQDRLFVLIPLLDLTEKVGKVDIRQRIEELKKLSKDLVEGI